jgi:hypothetical protein
LQIANLDTYYASYWDTPGPGAVSVAAGSSTVTGVGTTFTSTFCQGPGNPTVPKSASKIIFWYPTNTPGVTGRRWYFVQKCVDDTHLTLANYANTAAANWYPDLPASSGMLYSYPASNQSIWLNNSEPADFYDVIAAFYSLYYRTGIDDYLAAARKWADRWWSFPRIDQGTACQPNAPDCIDSIWSPKNQGFQGLVLRALDGRPEMWTGPVLGLNGVFDYYIRYLDNVIASGWTTGDVRELGYEIATIGYCALVDPDLTYRTKCQAALSRWEPWLAANQQSDGSWDMWFYGGKSTWLSAVPAITLSHGDTAVTCTNCFASTDFPNLMWFMNSTGAPVTNADGDPVTYTPSFVDASHITLDRPYEGATGQHGWQISGIPGVGTQPFLLGIFAMAMDFASKALATTDPVNSAHYRQFVIDIANWERDYGYWPSTKGMYYMVNTIPCQPPISDNNSRCTYNNTVGQARTLNAEAWRAVMAGYAYTRDSSLLAIGDTLYNANFAKPGTCPSGSTVCLPDGEYQGGFDDGNGWSMTGTPPVGQAHKYFGMFFGIGAGAAWPAYRIGGPQGVTRRQVYVGFNGARIPGAAGVRATATAPDGESIQVSCSSSPCAVPIDARQGEHIFRIEYLSHTGAVLAASEATSDSGNSAP